MAQSVKSKLPPNLDINSQNAATEWKLWKQQFDDYMVATGGDKKEDKIKMALLRNIMGPDAVRIVSTLPLTEAETTYDKLIEAIENYVNPRSSTVFERYKFNRRTQQEGEPFEHFLRECRELLKSACYEVKTENGMKVDPARVESLLQLKTPKNREELQRVIGSFNYVRRYVPEMAELLTPLCRLLKKDCDFKWLPFHDKCFQKLKIIISQAPALTPFDPSKQIILQCDASQNGIGCCLFQEHNKMLKLVACVSRTMSQAELGYSQSEKELLSICYGVSKFHKYIYGVKNVIIQTDHKPLLCIMEKHIDKIGSVRLKRLRLKLLMYSLTLVYVPGKNLHFADLLSRNCIVNKDYKNDFPEMVHSVSVHLPMSQERKLEFRKESSNDPLLQKLCHYCYKGWPSYKELDQDCKQFYKLRDNLYTEAGMVFYGDKIVVPNSLKNYVMSLIHQGHPGVTKAIAKARQLFYWNYMATDIIKHVQKCAVCEKYRVSNKKEQLIPHEIPNQRWQKVGIDICEYGGNSYLVIIDYYSHWIELQPLPSKTSSSVINAMQNVFTRLGFPCKIVADHVPFSSLECMTYFKSKDIYLINSSPNYPRSNGLAERAVGICKNILRKSCEDKVDYRESVMQYNNTPLSGFHASPSQILNSKIMRSNLPVTSKMLEPKVVKDAYKFLCLKQIMYKINHDKMARRKTPVFVPGESVTVREGKEWTKGKIIQKREEPRSYNVSKDGRVYRRNTYHLRKSYTSPHRNENSCLDYDTVEYNNNNKVINNHSHVSSSPTQNVTYSDSNNIQNQSVAPSMAETNQYVTRKGRLVKPPVRLDL